MESLNMSKNQSQAYSSKAYDDHKQKMFNSSASASADSVDTANSDNVESH